MVGDHGFGSEDLHISGSHIINPGMALEGDQKKIRTAYLGKPLKLGPV